MHVPDIFFLMRHVLMGKTPSRLGWRAVAIAVVAVGLFVGTIHLREAAAQSQFDVLVFSKTEGYRHASIPDGIAAIRALGAEHGFSVTATEEATRFTPDTLSTYAVVIFLNTSDNVLNEAQQSAFQQYIRGGGGFVGVHAATDTEYEWPWYNRLVGAYFDGHPSVQQATLTVADSTHPSTRMLPNPWTRTDEWYSFRAVQDDLNVLLNLDEDSYTVDDTLAMGAHHPVAWYHRFDGGRAWYTALGHTAATYQEPLYQAHLWGGIRWAAGEEGGE